MCIKELIINYYSSFYKCIINRAYSHIKIKIFFIQTHDFLSYKKIFPNSFIFFRHIFTTLFSFAIWQFLNLFYKLILYWLANIFLFIVFHTFLMHSLILLFIALSVSFSLPVLMVHNFQWKVCCQNLLSSSVSVNGCSWEPALPSII